VPIVPCFDPVTGASGGPAPTGGGASLFGVVPTVIDLTDGTWTLYDPDSLINTTYGTNGVTFSGGFNTVQWAGLGIGDRDYNWAAGGDHRAPRWYKNFEIDGNAVETGAIQVYQSIIEADLTVSDFNEQVVCGVAVDAASTSLFTVDGSGGYFARVQAGNPEYGTWQYSAQTSGVNSNSVKGYGAILRGALNIGSGVYIAVDAGGERTVSGSRNGGNTTAAASAPQHLMVGFGIRSSTDAIPDGSEQRVKLAYVAFTPAP